MLEVFFCPLICPASPLHLAPWLPLLHAILQSCMLEVFFCPFTCPASPLHVASLLSLDDICLHAIHTRLCPLNDCPVASAEEEEERSYKLLIPEVPDHLHMIR